MKACRICGGQLELILKYKNTPGKVQNLPDKKEVANDKGIDLEIYQCRFCGMMQHILEPVAYYKDVIRSAAVSPEILESKQKQLKEFIEKHSLCGKLFIEVGCGKGEFLSLINKCGVDAVGLENSPESVKICTKNGLSVINGFMDSKQYKLDKVFDGFVMFNYLEHLPDPKEVLMGVANNLNPEAIGIIEVPNADMLFSENLHSEFMLDHIFYFTKKTFVNLIEQCGFEVLECSEIWYNYVLSAVVKKRVLHNTEKMIRQSQNINAEIETLINDHRNEKIAVWGASHQAFFVLSQINNADVFEFIIDSAVMKQGKYSPVSHLPIVSPEAVDFNLLTIILVTAGSYSDEVAKLLKDKFHFEGKICVLRPFGIEEIN
jgi:2-polyprenyl-3-methyl-5-hydroxy-6-metoxy-1,4-benzoquinol methylase